MKSFITIGDIHGRDIWKQFADIQKLLSGSSNQPLYNYYVFLGDYCDSFTESNMTIRDNLLEIIRFKTLYPDNVILLWGNHDVEYLKNLPWLPIDGNVAGFRSEMHYDLFEIFNNNRDLFQLAFQEKNYLFSHSGVHFGWYHFVFTKAIKGRGMEDMTIAEQLNEAFNYRLECLFDIDWYRGGNKKVGGPLWCDKKLTSKKPLMNTHQIVGHTATDDIITCNINDSTSITYCDVLHKKKAFYTIFI